MDLQQFCRDLEGMLKRPTGSLHQGMDLLDIGEWDSMRTLEFAVFAQERYGKRVSAAAIAGVITIDELFGLVSG